MGVYQLKEAVKLNPSPQTLALPLTASRNLPDFKSLAAEFNPSTVWLP